MARFSQGIHGPFTGKVGQVIGSSRNGVPYMKGLYKDRTEEVSDKELLNRRKFAAAQLWLRPALEFLKVGWKGHNLKAGAFLSAKSYLMKNALQVQDNAIFIDPALVKVSSGELPMAENAAVSRSGPRELTFTWDFRRANDINPKDQVMMLATDPKGNHKFWIVYGQYRSACTDILPFYSKIAAGTLLHIYIAFVAADRSRQSDSLYLGEIIV